jgi:hypothetical protein
MIELIIKFGLVSVATVTIIVFLVVYYLAEPRKEISFWGIRFHKKWMPKVKFSWRKVPKVIPMDWQQIFIVFKISDSYKLHETDLFERANIQSRFTELRVREICVEMEKYGLVEHSFNYYILQDRAYKLVNKVNAV